MATSTNLLDRLAEAIVANDQTILFVLSAACSLFTATTIFDKPSKKYLSILAILFQPLVTIPRHSVEKAFEIRKIFFRTYWDKVCLEYAIDGSSNIKVIHIAGTKGKGSTVEYIAAAIRSTVGNHVGIFTSPHIHTARERFRINEQLISIKDFIKCSQNAIRYSHETHGNAWMVFFDYLVLIATEYFLSYNIPTTERKLKLNYILLETGIGGRFDSTNFLASVEVAVITRIGLDHQALLGDTVEEIAFQKAGIIKPHCHVFTPANQLSSVLKVIRDQCEQLSAILHEVPVAKNNIPSELLAQQTHWYAVQVENLCLSMAVLQHLNVPLDGLRNFYWPCRMETFQLTTSSTTSASTLKSTLTSSAPTHHHRPRVTCVVDGSHNGESVGKFLSSLRAIDEYKHSVLLVLFGAGEEKNVSDMLRLLSEQVASAVPVPMPGSSSAVSSVPLPSIDWIQFVQCKHYKAMSEQQLEKLFVETADPHTHMHTTDNSDQTAAAAAAAATSSTNRCRIISSLQWQSPYERTRAASVSGGVSEAMAARERSSSGTLQERLEYLIDEFSAPQSDFYTRLVQQSASQRDQQHGGNAVNDTASANAHIVVAICGSLFVAAEAREILFSKRPELFAETDWVREADCLL